MPFSSSTGVYTPASGATTAAAGNVVQSATWNNINNDYTTALTFVGQGKFAQQVPNPSVVTLYATPVQQNVNFAASAGDIASFAVNLPVSVSFYRIQDMTVYGAAANLGAGTISLYTAANGGGTQVVGSVALAVTSSLVNTAGAVQVIQPSVSTYMLNAGIIYLHVSTSNAASSTANVMLGIRPLF